MTTVENIAPVETTADVDLVGGKSPVRKDNPRQSSKKVKHASTNSTDSKADSAGKNENVEKIQNLMTVGWSS
jgi:hypothetical protein